MSKPKLLYLSTNLNIGGTEKFLVTVAENLRNQFDIRVGVIHNTGFFGKYLLDSGFDVIKCPTPWRTAKYLKENDICILHTFLFWAHISGRIARKLAGMPFVVTTQQAVDSWKKPYHTFLDRFTAPLCDVFVANSKAAADRLMKAERVPQSKIRVVYNGIDTNVFNSSEARDDIRKELNLGKKSFVAGCVSRLHYDKGVDYLPEIAVKSPGCVFLIAGDGPYRSLMLRKIEEHKLQAQFIFAGWRQDIARILKACDIFILPSREESFPQAALEAMAMGLPVIAADVGGVSELVKNEINGLLAAKGDIKGFSDAVNRFRLEPKTLFAMGAQAKITASKFGEKEMINNISLVYSELLTVNKPQR